jgi:transcriptional regulator with XRE-family HTH domain
MRAGLTQGDVAARMGTTQSVVACIESGRGTPSIRTVQRFANAVGARAVVRMEPLTTLYAEQQIIEITPPIRINKDYRAALRIVSKLVDQALSPDTPAGEHLDALSTLIGAYERRHHPCVSRA